MGPGGQPIGLSVNVVVFEDRLSGILTVKYPGYRIDNNFSGFLDLARQCICPKPINNYHRKYASKLAFADEQR